MKMMKWIAGLVTVFLAFLFLNGIKGNNTPVQASNNIKVTYTLKKNNKQFANKKVTVKDNATVLNGLKKGWKVKIADKDMVSSIDGHSQNNKKQIYWTYTINGKSSNKSVMQQHVKNNNHVVFNLSKMSN
ncbi:DUF4430 domain-containing protein [Limosilactobacillus panis]|uniref:Transcobalamin-like C-terminal domain-containing protein n=1 Tax=Limosilactobacillus panis DSM 6035 TaxID=1423782 RepID=A0A0R1XF65_9LACO|nr:DUF4430 domain-containing protein [Limosilactobacillus panis]KRM28767.1 hypothetical protein FD32_GL001653 [Limosilactobacillus panis DSM 6035]